MICRISAHILWRLGKLTLCGVLIFGTLACTTTTLPHSSFESADVHDQELSGKNKLAEMSPAHLIALGNDYLEKNNAPLAQLHFGMALEKAPGSIPALTGIGRALYRQKKRTEARKVFSRVLKKEPENILASLFLGKIYREQGNPKEALKALLNAREKKKNDPDILTELAMTYEDLGMETQATPLFKRVVKLRPNLAASHNNLGFSYLLEGRYADAILSFEQAYAFNPKNKIIQCNLGAAYALDDQEGKALRIFQTTLGKAEAYNNVGYFAMVRGDYEAAERDFHRAIQLKPSLYLKADQNLSRLESIRSEVYAAHPEPEEKP